MEFAKAVDFARKTPKSTLITIRANGQPQLSNVFHHVSDDGKIRISITTDRAKYRNLARDPWAALHITRNDFFGYVVLEGEAELTPVAADPHDAVVDELIEQYRGATGGEHEDWDAFRVAMVAERRVVVRFTPSRAYGMLELP
jgi:PPOX class probable F420-dependent enzyme